MERDVKDLAHLLSRGVIDRRRFVMMAIAMGVAAPAAVALADRAVAATPKKGGRFRLASTGASIDGAGGSTGCTGSGTSRAGGPGPGSTGGAGGSGGSAGASSSTGSSRTRGTGSAGAKLCARGDASGGLVTGNV